MDLNNLVSRTPLNVTFDQLVQFLEDTFPQIGKIKNYEGIYEGYEDANIILESTGGKYVLKIFANFRSDKNIQDYVKVIIEAAEKGVQTLELVKGKYGYISIYGNAKFIVTKFFNGKNFVDTTPTTEEILKVTRSLAKLNTLNLDIEESYDSWGNKNIIKEFAATKVQDRKTKEEVKILIDRIVGIDFQPFKKGVIHGDMQKKHVLKDKDILCIIDFGCMSYDYIVYELSTFLAWFCIDSKNWSERNEIVNIVVSEYSKIVPLSMEEIGALKILIAASYAAYFLKTTELIEGGDASIETQTWYNEAKELFNKSLQWIEEQ